MNIRNIYQTSAQLVKDKTFAEPDTCKCLESSVDELLNSYNKKIRLNHVQIFVIN